MIVADATPLIHLTRSGHLDLLPRLYERVVIPMSVRDESFGGSESRPETEALRSVSKSWLEARALSAAERKASEALRRGAPVGRGEADAIALAASLRTVVLMDDQVAVGLARMKGLETRWTTSVVLEAHRRGILDRIGARRAIEDLVGAGLWVRQDALLRILAILREG